MFEQFRWIYIIIFDTILQFRIKKSDFKSKGMQKKKKKEKIAH